MSLKNTLPDRDKKIVRVSEVGIAVNVGLAASKAIIGFVTNSIAITLDAVNNLSDVLSSCITIFGAKYAQKAPDREHPLGHGRAEQLSALLISIIILYAGLTALIESVKKIIFPEVPKYTALSIALLFIAVFAKILLALFTERAGKKLNSEALIGSGKDAVSDVLISASTIVAAFIFIVFGISTEAYLGIIIACIIMKSGIEMLSKTLSQILGARISPELSRNVKRTLTENPLVYGAYDLMLHNYGPDKYLGSVHIEVEESLNADEIDDLSRELTRRVYNEHGVMLEAIGIYAVNTSDPQTLEMHKKIMAKVHSHDYVLQTHGFHVDFNPNVIYADVIIDFSAPDRAALCEEIQQEIRQLYPDFEVNMILDTDVSD